MRRSWLAASLVMSLVLSAERAARAHEFDWKSLLLASLKLREKLDYDANVDSYMEVFRPDVWKRYRNDEFELAVKREESAQLMKAAIDRFSLNESFVLRTTTQFGSYDFKKQQFPVTGWNETSYFYQYAYPYAGFPGNIKVFFSNPRDFEALPMPAEAARTFLRSRKSSSGSVDRQLNVILSLRITALKQEPDERLAEIRGVRVFADEKHTHLIHECTLPAGHGQPAGDRQPASDNRSSQVSATPGVR